MDSFNDNFKKMQQEHREFFKQVQGGVKKGAMAAFVIWLLSLLCYLSLLIGVIWVAIHFISKYW
jgi:hypothetical protein